MRITLCAAAAAMALTGCGRDGDVNLLPGLGQFEVIGVEDDDMLKMRAGPGMGFVTVLGLPNGTIVNVESCQPMGNTRWCAVTLGGINGHVSAAYLQER